ncbi:RHS repeat domain-containing protein [Rhodocyclus tenuis]|uniref:YD repeat-containing protein n=1 Tax=Rhodocyclus tenuis TaxID=1066 RepID=A0A840GCF6_RHOTE|nr:RHS repeat domain-containing protein [Rhodocyclus tenuis]MBB4249151.1 YD repeat-containing protein [Rhodocyclus tenuis]
MKSQSRYADVAPRWSVAQQLKRAVAGGLAFASLAFGGGALAQEVIPDFYRDPGLYPNRAYVNQSANEHIDPFTGALQWHFTDIHLPGNGGFDLKVTRSYNSATINPDNPAASYDSIAGLGWTIHFGRVLKTKDAYVCLNKNALSVVDNPALELPDGSRQLLAFTGSTSPLLLSTQRWRADCAPAGQTGLIVYSPDGVRYDMTQVVNVGSGVSPVYAFYTTKITDRNGNYATVSYANGSSPEITSVTTSDGRSLSFSYADSGTLTRRIASITGSGGQTYSYGYQDVSGVAGLYYLTTVTRPGGTTWNFSYNGNLGGPAGSYLMNRATYPEGGYINYSYGYVYFDTQANPSYRTDVVTAKSLSIGGSWSFAYTPGSLNNYDTTTVTSPVGTTTYKHIGPNYSSSGTVWMVGLLMSKTTGSLQTETYTWTKQKIGSENFLRPGQFVLKVDAGETNAPLMTQRTITRDGATYTTSYSNFDAYGNPQTVSESGPNGGARTTSLSYYINTTKWIVKQAENETFTGSSITRSFDANGNLTAMTRDGVTTTYAYDGEGNVTTATLPRSLVHSFGSYKRGIPQTESQPEAIALSRVVSEAGNVTSEKNGEAKTTTFAYDALNRMTAVGYPVGNAVSIAYAKNSKTASRGSLIESTVIDGFGRPTSITLGGVARTYTYDALGRRTFASNPGASTGTSYTYDILNRVTRETNADGTYRSYTYGAGTIAVTDERSKVTTQAFRAYGNPDQRVLMSITAPDTTANVTIARNTKDLVTSVVQGGLTRKYAYNANYYLTSVTNPETGTTTYGRDVAGNMTSRTVGASGTSSYTYDRQNRLTAVTYPGTTPSVAQTYSKTHKLKSVVSSVASRSYTYDANDNLTGESIVVDGITLTTGYAYNGKDQLSSITYPQSARVVTYSPDVLGRPTAVSGYVTGVTYWPSGQVSQIAYANGTVSNYGQNSRLWPSSFATQKAGTYYNNAAYTYDGVGNLTAIADTADTSFNRSVTYDALNRLSTITGPWGSGTIAYNGTGNITSQVFGTAGLYYTYDAQNRLSSVSGSRAGSYTYDAYGDMLTAPGATYTWDGAPNLLCVNCADTANKVENSYDGLNQRVSVTKGGVKTYEVYGSHGNLLVEYTPSQAGKLVEYLYLGGKRVAQRETTQ